MYQSDPSKEQQKLARQSLNTIRQANVQISVMSMPRALLSPQSGGFNLYNPDGY
jgi:hypothetical protein